MEHDSVKQKRKDLKKRAISEQIALYWYISIVFPPKYTINTHTQNKI